MSIKSKLAGILAACLLALSVPAFAQQGATNPIALLTNAAATGTAQTWPGGAGFFAVSGTFGGATVKLQFLGPDGTTWIDVGTALTVTAVAGATFNLPRGQVRGAIVGGASVSVTASVAALITFIG